MFSVSLSTLSTEGERREGGLAVPTGTLAFSGDSGTRAKPGKNKRLCKPYFVRFLSHTPPDLLLSDQMMKLHLAKCSNPKRVLD